MGESHSIQRHKINVSRYKQHVGTSVSKWYSVNTKPIEENDMATIYEVTDKNKASKPLELKVIHTENMSKEQRDSLWHKIQIL